MTLSERAKVLSTTVNGAEPAVKAPSMYRTAQFIVELEIYAYVQDN